MSHEDKNYIGVRNPEYVNAENTHIFCEVNFEHLPEQWVGFTCVSKQWMIDNYDADYAEVEPWYTYQIWDEIIAGDYGAIQPYVEPDTYDDPLQEIGDGVE